MRASRGLNKRVTRVQPSQATRIASHADTSHTFKTRPRKPTSIGVPRPLVARRMPMTDLLLAHELTLQRSDTWELWELWRHPAVHEPLFGPSSMAVDTAVALLNACARSDAGVWVVRSRQTSRLLGALCLRGWPRKAQHPSTLPPPAHRGEFSVALLPAARGQGHAQRAARLLLSYAFDRLGLSEMSAACNADDAPAQRLLGRLGFRAGTVRPGPAGPRIDHLLLKREFVATAGPCELESREWVAAVPLRCA
jgi:RimJ/RimL family protein N-acetyltransferase